MSYAQITNLIFSILGGALSLLCLHFVVFAIVGIFTHKKFPKAKVMHKYGLIIPARNEEKVVGNLIESIQKNNYPQELLQIFVIAHNCTDRTAEIARSLGATVYEYNNPNECTMGYAFRHLFDCINRDYGTQNYDGFFLFNADNVLDKDYISKMNDAFDAGDCKNVITSFRNSKNFGSNLMTGLYGVYFMSGCRYESRGRTVCGCSTRVQGCGYVISSKLVENGWPYVTLTEDWEFSADQVLRGSKIVYCDEAVFYDEQPTSVRVMLRQRIRWSKGHLLVCLSRTKDLFKGLFRKKKDGEKKVNRFSIYDITVNCMPICVASGFISILSFIFFCFTPLFVKTDLATMWKEWAIGLATGAASGYLTLLLSGIIIFVLERKRIKNVSLWKKIAVTLLWPIFLALSVPIEFLALFAKNLGWKTIPHTDTTTFEKLNEDNSVKVEDNAVIVEKIADFDENGAENVENSTVEVEKTANLNENGASLVEE